MNRGTQGTNTSIALISSSRGCGRHSVRRIKLFCRTRTYYIIYFCKCINGKCSVKSSFFCICQYVEHIIRFRGLQSTHESIVLKEYTVKKSEGHFTLLIIQKNVVRPTAVYRLFVAKKKMCLEFSSNSVEESEFDPQRQKKKCKLGTPLFQFTTFCFFFVVLSLPKNGLQKFLSSSFL